MRNDGKDSFFFFFESQISESVRVTVRRTYLVSSVKCDRSFLNLTRRIKLNI